MKRRTIAWLVGLPLVAALTWFGLTDGSTPDALEAQSADAPAPTVAPVAPRPTAIAADEPDGGDGASTDTHDVDHDHDHEGEDELPALDERVEAIWDDATRADVQDAAEQVIAAYLADLDTSEQWWQELAPLLTDGAQYVYADVPHELLAPAVVTGVEIVEANSPLLAVAVVSTTDEDWRVTLTRWNGAEPWLADKIVPEGEDA